MSFNIDKITALVKSYIKHNITWKGRANRRSYWFVSLLIPLLITIPLLISGFIASFVLGLLNLEIIAQVIFGILFMTLGIGTIILTVTTDIRRLHDLSLPGYLYFIIFAIILLIIQTLSRPLGELLWFVFLLLLGVIPGKKEANKYGNPPPAKDLVPAGTV